MKCKSKLGPSPHQTESAAVTLQAFIQGYQARKLFGELQRIREIQRNALNQYRDLKSSVLTLQSAVVVEDDPVQEEASEVEGEEYGR